VPFGKNHLSRWNRQRKRKTTEAELQYKEPLSYIDAECRRDRGKRLFFVEFQSYDESPSSDAKAADSEMRTTGEEESLDANSEMKDMNRRRPRQNRKKRRVKFASAQVEADWHVVAMRRYSCNRNYIQIDRRILTLG